MFKKKAPEPQSRRRVAQDVSQSTSVFSYHTTRTGAADPRGRQMAQQPSDKPRRQRRLPLWLKPKNLLSAIIILTIFLLLVGLDRNPKIVITGDESAQIFARDSQKYQEAAHAALRQSILNGNKLTVDTSVVSGRLTKDFPELRTVSVSLPVIGRQPIVYVQPATPQILLVTQHDGTFVLDSAGRALAVVTPQMKLPTEDKALPSVVDQSGIRIKSGDIALPSNSVRFITEVVGQLKTKEIGMESLTLPQQASELDVKIAGTPYFVKFSLQGRAREQSGTFLATRDYLIGKNVIPSQYIDARVTGRAYYK